MSLRETRVLFTLVAILIQTSCGVFKNTTHGNIPLTNNVVIAHRGAWKTNNLPQNSIAALRQAIKLKCAGSEFDVRMTADDSLIINHDPDYNDLRIEKTNYKDLIGFKLSNGEKLPTLREYIIAGIENNNSTRLICEIKPSDISKERGKEVAGKVLGLVKELKAQSMLDYISFDYDILKKIIAINPEVNAQYLDGNKTPEELKADGINGADYHFSVFKSHPDWIERAKKNGIKLNAWTVNDTNDIDWLLANELDYITTNEPELVFKRVEKSPVSTGWKLMWSDEFNYNGLPDSSKWSYNVGGHGWGNNELQYYTTNDTLNAISTNGLLKIIVRKQAKEGNQYTSARLVTKGKAEFKYGKIEIRAKLPAGRGLWPAIWMLGSNIGEVNWPESGEIDIMEHVGYNKDSILGTIHTETYNHMKGTQKVKYSFINNPYYEFHNFSLEWTPEKIDFMLDGVVFNHIVNEHLSTKEWPFDQPFFLILNIAVGGGLGGKMGVDETIFPATMEIDYVRVFQK